MIASYELQTAIFTLLQADAPLAALVGDRVFDDVPDNQDVFPYVNIGEDTLNQWDNDSDAGFSATVSIHTWSRYKGRKETKQVQGAIYDALHNASLPITGYNAILIQQRSEQSFVDPDGKTRHGVQIFNVLFN